MRKRSEAEAILKPLGAAIGAAGLERFDLRDHGAAVRRGLVVSYCVMAHPRDGRDRVYVGFNTGGPYVIVELDPATGRCVQYDADSSCQSNPGAQGPWDMEPTPEGRLLIAGADGSVSELDPRARTLKVLARAPAWFSNICRGADGKYYLGDYPGTILYRFDRATCALEPLGAVDPANKYARMLEADGDGFVYAITGMETARAFAYEIATGRFRSLLPRSEERTGMHQVRKGRDGGVYLRCVSGRHYRLEQGRARLLKAAQFPGFAFPELRDGTPVSLVDPDGIKLGVGRRARRLPLVYTATPTEIFHLGRGPRDTIYAGTILPLYLLRYTPATRRLENLGRGGPDSGEIYSLAPVGNALYYATYSGARLMRYDPDRPIRQGQSVSQGWGTTPVAVKPWNGNPRWIADLGTGHCRTRAMHVDASERVWVGSEPEYGKYHGGLACYDTRRRKLHNHPVVIRHQSINALTSAPDAAVVYGGSSIVRGSSTDPVEQEAFVFGWDVARERVAWKVVPVPGTTSVNNLHMHDGLLHGTSTGNYTFFTLDPATRRTLNVFPSPWAGVRPESMCLGPDGAFYGITWCCLFRWQPGRAPTALVRCVGRKAARFPGGSLFHRGAVIVDGRYYFSCGASVVSVRLPTAAKTRRGRRASVIKPL